MFSVKMTSSFVGAGSKNSDRSHLQAGTKCNGALGAAEQQSASRLCTFMIWINILIVACDAMQCVCVCDITLQADMHFPVDNAFYIIFY